MGRDREAAGDGPDPAIAVIGGANPGVAVQVKPRVLIVDDEAPLLSSLATAAGIHGYEVRTAADGREAMQLLEIGQFDVVVTDLRMPELDGPGLLSHIQTRNIRAKTIVITGHATLEAAVDCLRKGAVDFLVKPFEVEAFLASLGKATASTDPVEAELDWGSVARSLRLTRRQREILRRFYATGKSNRELAADLCLSLHTVKSHLKAAFQKAGVSTRAQLLQKLREIG